MYAVAFSKRDNPRIAPLTILFKHPLINICRHLGNYKFNNASPIYGINILNNNFKIMQLLQISASDLQRFLESSEELLRESEEMQMALRLWRLALLIASFSDTPRSLLEILVNSEYSAVVEVARLHVNFAGILGDYQETIGEVLRNVDLGQNDRLAVESA